MWRYRARIRLHASAADVRARIAPVAGAVEPLDDTHCLFSTGADTLPTLAAYLGLLDVDFEVLDPPELVAHVRAVGERYLRAAGREPGDQGADVPC